MDAAICYIWPFSFNSKWNAHGAYIISVKYLGKRNKSTRGKMKINIDLKEENFQE